MKITGVIAEYNPFHRGHEYQLQAARRLSGADAVIVVMSGDFVQRGEAAIVDKYARTRMALEGGADLVLELPPAWATGSAEVFARGAVSLLEACGCVTGLSFGAETADAAVLQDTARLLLERQPELEEGLRSELKKGLAYPRAYGAALKNMSPEAATVLKEPNNLLAVEYLKALQTKKLNWNIVPVPRLGQGHRSQERDEGRLASASVLRQELRSGKAAWQLTADLPEYTVNELNRFLPEHAEAGLLGGLLLRLRREERSLTDFEDVSPELAARIRQLPASELSSPQLAEKLAARNLSLARIRRALLHILLDIPAGSGRHEPLAIKLLGLNAASPAAAELKKNARLPIVTKTADDRQQLTGDISYASDIYNLLAAEQVGLCLRSDLQTSPVIKR